MPTTVNGLSFRLKTLPMTDRIAAEPLHPQAIAHHRRRRSAGPIVGGHKRAPGVCPNAEHREVVAGDELSGIGFGSLGLAGTPHAKSALAGREGRQLRKARRVVAELRKELVGDERKLFRLAVATPVAATRFPAQAIQLAGIRAPGATSTAPHGPA